MEMVYKAEVTDAYIRPTAVRDSYGCVWADVALTETMCDWPQWEKGQLFSAQPLSHKCRAEVSSSRVELEGRKKAEGKKALGEEGWSLRGCRLLSVFLSKVHGISSNI